MKFNINAVNCNSVLRVTCRRFVLFVSVRFVIPFFALFFASSVWFSFLYLK